MNSKNIKNVIIQKCDDEFNSLMDIYKNKYQECRDNIDLYINKCIIKTIGDDLYDYQKIKTYDKFVVLSKIQFSPHIKFGNPKYKYITKYNSLKSFEDTFVIGEKYILYYKYIVNSRSNYRDEDTLYVTNYGRMMLLHRYYRQIKQSVMNHNELNFWIPIDYVYIIQTLVSQFSNGNDTLKTHVGCEPYAKLYGTIKKILTHLRDNLLNGKYVKIKIEKEQLIKDQNELKNIY